MLFNCHPFYALELPLTNAWFHEYWLSRAARKVKQANISKWTILLHSDILTPNPLIMSTYGGMSSSRCFFDIVDIAMLTISCRYRVNIGTMLNVVYIFDIAMLTISCLYRVNIGTLSSVACLTLFTSFTSSTSRCWLYRRQYRAYIGTPSYLVDIVYIVDIAMLTISCRYRVDIGTLSYLVYIVDIVMLTISSSTSCRHRYPCHTSITSSTSRSWRYRIDIV